MGEASSAAPSGSASARFPLARRLKRKRLIEPLFDRRNPDTQSVASGSVRLLYRFVPVETVEAPFQVGVAVGRSRGHAPRRNRVKRVIRDALRHDQLRLECIASNASLALTAMVLFQGKDEPADRIRDDLDKALAKLEQRTLHGPR